MAPVWACGLGWCRPIGGKGIAREVGGGGTRVWMAGRCEEKAGTIAFSRRRNRICLPLPGAHRLL